MSLIPVGTPYQASMHRHVGDVTPCDLVFEVLTFADHLYHRRPDLGPKVPDQFSKFDRV